MKLEENEKMERSNVELQMMTVKGLGSFIISAVALCSLG